MSNLQDSKAIPAFCQFSITILPKLMDQLVHASDFRKEIEPANYLPRYSVLYKANSKLVMEKGLNKLLIQKITGKSLYLN